jgi:hypothetical protein
MVKSNGYTLWLNLGTLQKIIAFQKANLTKMSTLTKRYVHLDKRFGT